MSNRREQELCLSPAHHPIAITGPGIKEAPPWRHTGSGNEKSQLLSGLQCRGFRQKGGKSRVPKAGAQVADLRRAGSLGRVQEGKQRRHREESGAGAEARP